MSSTVDPQRRAFEFLLERFHTQEPFTKQEFRKATGWAEGTFKTYCSKQFKELLVPVGESYRVHGIFGQFSNWPRFHEHVVTQKRKLARAYEASSFESVVVFEFFMPLRNEEYLRGALDALFFKDSVITRLKSIEIINETQLRNRFPIRVNEARQQYFDRMASWIAEKFVGYSIHHVNGRFRVGALRTHEEILRQQTQIGDRYLVDETTAVVRFIIPCDASPKRQGEKAKKTSRGYQTLDEKTAEQASQIGWFFDQLFVQRIIEAVAGEDEIWLLESGLHNRLHIWKAVAENT